MLAGKDIYNALQGPVKWGDLSGEEQERYAVAAIALNKRAPKYRKYFLVFDEVFNASDPLKKPCREAEREVEEWFSENPEAIVLEQSVNTDGASYYVASFLVELPVP